LETSRKYYRIGLLISWLIVICIYSFANQCGLGFTYDSEFYLEIAKQIGEVGFSAEGFQTKPPLYPLLIHVVGISGIWWTNLFFLLVSISVLYVFGSEIKNQVLRVGFRFLMATSFPLYWVHSFAWTEPLFICLLLVAFYCLNSYEKSGNRRLLLLSILLLLTLSFVRYAGIFILFPTFIYLFATLPKKLKLLLFGFFLVGFLGISLWVFNFQEGFLERWRITSTRIFNLRFYFVEVNLDAYTEAFSLWFLPLNLYKPIRVGVVISVILAIIFRSFQLWSRKEKSILYFFAFIFIIYYFSMHWTFSVKYFEAERYLTPLYSCLFLSLFLWIDEFGQRIGRKSKLILHISLFFLLAYTLGRTGKNIMFWNGNRCKNSTEMAFIENYTN
jgi:hypothetical protein